MNYRVITQSKQTPILFAQVNLIGPWDETPDGWHVLFESDRLEEAARWINHHTEGAGDRTGNVPGQREIDRLEAAQRDWRKTANEITSTCDAEIREKVELYRQQVTRAVEAKYKNRVQIANLHYQQATEAYEVAVERRGLSGADAPYPLGTKLYEWDRPGRGKPFTLTGRCAVVEVVTRKSQYHFPENAKWGLPNLGRCFARILKKDGTLSKQFIRECDFAALHWLPEGEKPKET